MSIRLSAPRCSRSADSGALVSVNGTDAASLIVPPHLGRPDGCRCLNCLAPIWRGEGRTSQNSEILSHAPSGAPPARSVAVVGPHRGQLGKRFPNYAQATGLPQHPQEGADRAGSRPSAPGRPTSHLVAAPPTLPRPFALGCGTFAPG